MLTGPTHCYKPKRGSKQRECLRCSEVFISAGPQNRRCPKCVAWMQSEECPYSDGNFIYVVTGDDADTIQARRKINTANAQNLNLKKADDVRPG